MAKLRLSRLHPPLVPTTTSARSPRKHARDVNGKTKQQQKKINIIMSYEHCNYEYVFLFRYMIAQKLISIVILQYSNMCTYISFRSFFFFLRGNGQPFVEKRLKMFPLKLVMKKETYAWSVITQHIKKLVQNNSNTIIYNSIVKQRVMITKGIQLNLNYWGEKINWEITDFKKNTYIFIIH